MVLLTMQNAEFLEKAWSENGPKVISGFSRPLYHNINGLLNGYKYDKKAYGGMLRHTEAGMLCKWASLLKPGQVIVEIGTYGGLSTSYLSAGAAKSGARVIGIDPFNSDLEKQAKLSDNCVPLEAKPTKELVFQRLVENGFGDRVTLLEGYSQEVAAEWDGTKIDFLWIDGNHEQALKDYLDFKPFLNPGARVAVHDAHPRYGYADVVRDVKEIFKNDAEWRDMEHVKSIISGLRTD